MAGPILLGSTQFRVVVENTFITVKEADQHGVNSCLRRSRRHRTEPALSTDSADDFEGLSCGSKASEDMKVGRTFTQSTMDDQVSSPVTSDAMDLLSLFEEDSAESRARAIAAVRSCVRHLSLEASGCLAVQRALEAASTSEAIQLADELRGFVMQAVRSPHGNYVVQKALQVLPPERAVFVAEELLESCATMAFHCAGSRVISRVLERTGGTVSAQMLAQQVLQQEVCKLCRHRFGRHVIAAILEHGTPAQKAQVAQALRGEMVRYAKHQNAWLVAERALIHALPADRNALAQELLAHPNVVVAVARHATGQVVIEALVRIPGLMGQTALEHLGRARAKLQKDKYARQMLAALDFDAQRQ